MFIEVVKRCLLAATLVAASGCGPLSDEAKVVLGRHEYCIPKDHILNSPLPEWLKSVADLPPSSPSVTLYFPASEVARHIEGFRELNGQNPDNLIVGVRLLDADDLQTYSDPEMHVFSDAWYGRGGYEGAAVVPHQSGLYQLRGAMWPVGWRVAKIPPDPSERSPDDPYSWYMGSCFEGNYPLAETKPHYVCKTRYLHEDLRIIVSFDEVNLPVVEEIRAFIVERLRSWSVGASAEASDIPYRD